MININDLNIIIKYKLKQQQSKMSQQITTLLTNSRFKKEEDSFAKIDVDIFRFNQLNLTPLQSSKIAFHHNKRMTSEKDKKGEHGTSNNKHQQTRRKYMISAYKTDRNQNNSTQEHVRLKVILQNKRLKQNLNRFAQDLQEYRKNQVKIGQVLKESKQKILEYKNRLKDKSKNISILTQEMIKIKHSNLELQNKIQTLTSFSEWQEKQNRDLKQEMVGKNSYVQELTALKAKIQHLQLSLKSYECKMKEGQIIEQQNIKIGEDFPLTDKIITSQTSIKQPNDYRSFSLKEMDAFDLDNIKHKVIDTQEIDKLQDINFNLKTKLSQVQNELIKLRSQISINQQVEVQNFQSQKQRQQIREDREDKEKSQKGQSNDKILHKLLQEKQQLIKTLQKNIQDIEQVHKNDLQQRQHYSQKLKSQVKQLYGEIQLKQRKILELSENLHDNQRSFKIQLQEIQALIEIKDLNIRSLQKQMISHNEIIQQKQQKVEELGSKIQELLSQRQENQYKLQNIQSFLYQKIKNQYKIQLQEDLHQQYKTLQNRAEGMQIKYNEALVEIQELKRQKSQYQNEMQMSAKLVYQLKVQIREVYKQKERSDSYNSQQHRSSELSATKSELIQNQTRIFPQQLSQIRNQGTSAEQNDSESKKIKIMEGQILKKYKSSGDVLKSDTKRIQTIQNEGSQLKERNLDHIDSNYQFGNTQQGENNPLLYKITLLQGQITELTYELDLKSQKIQEKQTTITNLQQIVDKKDIQIANGKQDNRNYEKTVTNLNNYIKNVSKQIQKYQRNVIELQQKMQKQKNSSNQLLQQKKQLQTSIQKLVQSQELLITNNKTLEQTLQQKFKEKEYIKQEYEIKNQEITILKNQIIDSQQKQKQYKQIFNQFNSEMVKIKEQLHSVYQLKQKSLNQSTKLQEEADIYKIKADKLEQKLKQKQAEILKYEQLMDNYSDDIQAQETQFKKQLQQKRVELQKMTKQLQVISRSSEQAERNLRLQLQQRQKQLTNTLNILDVIKINKQLLENQINEYDNNNRSLEKELFESTEMKIRIQSEITVYKVEKEKLLKKLSIAEDKMEEFSIYDKNKTLIISQQVQQLENIINKQAQKIKEISLEKQQLTQKNTNLLSSLEQITKQKAVLIQASNKQKQKYQKQSLQFISDKQRLNQQIDYNIEQNNNLKDKIMQIEQRLKQSDILKQNLRKQLEVKQKKIKDFTQNMYNLKSSLSLSNADRSSKKQSKESSSIQLKIQEQEQFEINVDNIKVEVEKIQAQQKSILQKYDQQIRDLQAQHSTIIVQKDSKLQQQESKVKMLESQVTERQEQIAKIKNHLNQKTQFCTELQTFLAQYETKNKMSEKKSKDNEQQINVFKIKLQQQQNINVSHQTREKQLWQTIQELKTKIIDLTELNQRKENQINVKQKQIQCKEGQLQEKTSKVREIQELLLLKNNVIQQNLNKINEFEHLCLEKDNQLQQFKAISQKEKAKLLEDLLITKKLMQQSQDQYEQKQGKMLKELSQYKVLLRELQRQKQCSIQQSHRSIRLIKQDLKLKEQFLRQKDQLILQHKQKVQRIREQFQQLKINSTKFKEEKEINQKSMKEKEDQLTKLNEEKLYLKQQINAYENNIQKIQMENDNYQESVNKYKKQLDQLNQENNTIKNDLQKIESKYKQKIEDLFHLQNKLKHVAQENQALKKQVQNKNLENHDLLSQLSRKNDQILQWEKMIQEKNEELNKSIVNLQKLPLLEEKNEELIKQIKNLETHSNTQGDIQKARQKEKLIHKEYQTKIQNIYLEKRQNLLEIERGYELELQKLREELNQSKLRKYQFQQLLSSSSSKLIQLMREIEKQKVSNQREERKIRQFQTEIGELTDKVIQFTQQINELNQIVENLRESNIAKDNEVEQCHEIIHKLQEAVKDYQMKEQAQILQVKELQQKCEKLKEKQTRQRTSTVDSIIQRSKNFDEKNNKFLGQYEDIKNKLQFAEAYIIELEDQCKKNSQINENNGEMNVQKNAGQLQKQINELKMKIQEQQAYIDHMESYNMNTSVKSRKSSSHMQKQTVLLQIPQISGHSKDSDLFKKINILVEFVQNYNKFESFEKEDQIKIQLQNPQLEELLSTIIYRIQKEINLVKDKKMTIVELQEDYETLEEQLRYEKAQYSTMKKKNDFLSEYEDKYEETQQALKQVLVQKMKKEADIAELKTYILSMQKKYLQQKDNLQVLQEQNEEEDEMMQYDADSQIPSSINQSKEFLQNYESNYRNISKASSTRLVQKSKSLNKNEYPYVQFLMMCHMKIQELEKEVSSIEKELNEKTHIISRFEENKRDFAKKLDTIESKIQTNNVQLKNQQKFNENQFIKYVKNFLDYLEENDQYGLQNEKRRKINEFLLSMENSLTKNDKRSEEERMKTQDNKKMDNSSKIKLELHEIKQDVINEDKGYSIVINSHVGGFTKQSYSYGEVIASQDINEVKQSCNELIKEMGCIKEELKVRQYSIKIMAEGFKMIEKQIFQILDEILSYCEENVYFEQQISQIKSLLRSYHVEQRIKTFKQDMSQAKSTKNQSILEQMEREPVESDFEKTLKMNESQFKKFVDSFSNDNLKEIYLKIENILNFRIEQSLQFLHNEKQLISDILKIKYESDIEFAINKLAIKLTKLQITDIITNSYNQMQAQSIINQVLNNDPQKSRLSAQDDFSPNIDKIQEIKDQIFSSSTELSLQLHNKLVEILGSPTRKQFYENINEFYTIIKQYEVNYQNRLSQIEETSERHSGNMKKMLDHHVEDEQFSRFDRLEIKNLKLRSGSCNVDNMNVSIEDLVQ